LRDLALLFSARCVRLFAYGTLAVVLALFLRENGLSTPQIGLLFSLTMAGDTLMSLFLTTSADRLGRRKTLIAGALLMLVASVVFAFSHSFWVLVAAATIGVLSPSGNEVGPFLPVEQAGLSEGLASDKRVQVFAWYNLAGYFSTAAGALLGGWGSHALQQNGMTPLESYRWIVCAHGAAALVMMALYAAVSKQTETASAKTSVPTFLGLHKSRGIVFKLSALFSVDAFAGGFVMQSLIAYWFHLRWGADESQLGTMLFFGNMFAGVSSLLAAPLSRRIGLVNTMVWTHLPSNILLVLVPFMPNLPAAAGVLLLRFCLSQMDVPTRQAFVVAVVDPDERSAAGGVTNVARSVGTTIAPALTGAAFAVPALGIPFLVAGGLKIVYDLALWGMARNTELN
jgi:MFS family permease